MDRIQVTPEMRARVLRSVQAAEIAARPKVLRFPAWKKYLPAAACLILVIAGAAALPRLTQLLPPREADVQVVPQIQEAATLAELSNLVGFEVGAEPALPFAPEEITYCSYWSELAQIQYSGQGRTATYRQSAGTQDNSGDYTIYGSVYELDLNGLTVTLKGGGGAYVLAVWTDGRFSYSLRLSQGAPAEEWLAILADFYGSSE